MDAFSMDPAVPLPDDVACEARLLLYADAELELEDPAPHPERAAQLRQMRGLVVRTLDQVPLKRRAVLIMHDIDQVPMREIALTLEINMFTAYSRLRKARLEFRAAAERFRMNRGWP